MSFYTLIRSHQTDSVISQLSELLRNMFQSRNTIMNIPLSYNDGRFQHRGEITVAPWKINDIIYSSIFYSNDYRCNVCSNQSVMHRILNEFNIAENIDHYEQENESLREFFARFLLGASQKQFWYQNYLQTVESYNRNYEIMTVGIERFPELDIDSILVEKTGFTFEELNYLHVSLFALARRQSNITNFSYDNSILRFSDVLTEDNINRMIDFYTGDYVYYRQSVVNENSLFSKPIVRTQRGNRYFLNIYLIARKLYDGTFWILRDHFRDINSQEFTNMYGYYFEAYMENLLGHYLEGCFERLPVIRNGKQADWKIELDNYVIYIEQKSTLLPIKLKRDFPRIDDLDDFIADRILQAFLQLDATDQRYETDKEILKFILTSDNYEVAETVIKPRVLSQHSDRLSSEESFYITSINEIEILLYLMSTNIDQFHAVINEKRRIDIEDRDFRYNHEFINVLSSLNCAENDYIYNVINHFNSFRNN